MGVLKGVLDGLSPDQKTALSLTEYEGMTQRDLAAELGISVSKGQVLRGQVQGAARKGPTQSAPPRLLPLRNRPP